MDESGFVVWLYATFVAVCISFLLGVALAHWSIARALAVVLRVLQSVQGELKALRESLDRAADDAADGEWWKRGEEGESDDLEL